MAIVVPVTAATGPHSQVPCFSWIQWRQFYAAAAADDNARRDYVGAQQDQQLADHYNNLIEEYC